MYYTFKILFQYFNKSLKFDLKINNVYTLYSHDDIFLWYTSCTDQILKSHQVNSLCYIKYFYSYSA